LRCRSPLLFFFSLQSSRGSRSSEPNRIPLPREPSFAIDFVEGALKGSYQNPSLLPAIRSTRATPSLLPFAKGQSASPSLPVATASPALPGGGTFPPLFFFNFEMACTIAFHGKGSSSPLEGHLLPFFFHPTFAEDRMPNFGVFLLPTRESRSWGPFPPSPPFPSPSFPRLTEGARAPPRSHALTFSRREIVRPFCRSSAAYGYSLFFSPVLRRARASLVPLFFSSTSRSSSFLSRRSAASRRRPFFSPADGSTRQRDNSSLSR